MGGIEFTEETSHFAGRHVKIASYEAWLAALCDAPPHLYHDVPRVCYMTVHGYAHYEIEVVELD